ncbi:Uncharacterised protein [Metamycoplasma arthritidis]|uniref:Uncharacterized protein n=1 Tax=Metamycoplasma arthritidis (strain 158L3-1) TaxID=243272 RepID=B3PLX4_META1|nr:hypothetical protein [Metamycoplasma arthritidis]ACF07026.1 hypothetical protein MARTH_orf070 [Metamycoplasma arthritidis 158L3-1]VEU78554.1 Uncharacterised protein [Metamycoplasma arthritidis]
MTKIYILIGILIAMVIFCIIQAIVLQHVIFKKTIFISLAAMKLIEEDELRINRKFYKWVFNQNAAKYMTIAVPWVLFGLAFFITLLFIEDTNKSRFFPLGLLGLFFLPIMLLITTPFTKVSRHFSSYRIMKSVENGKVDFFKNDIENQEEYDDFVKKLANGFLLDYFDQKNKVVKSYNFEKIKSYCLRKQKFNSKKLNYLLFADPKFLGLNGEKITLKELSYLRIYLFKEINNSAPFFV